MLSVSVEPDGRSASSLPEMTTKTELGLSSGSTSTSSARDAVRRDATDLFRSQYRKYLISTRAGQRQGSCRLDHWLLLRQIEPSAPVTVLAGERTDALADRVSALLSAKAFGRASGHVFNPERSDQRRGG